MARDFNDMLNEYLAVDMLKHEFLKQTYVFEKINKDDSWKGGAIPIPFESQGATSLYFGGLTASSDIGKYKYKRGYIQQSDMVEIWGSLKFEHRDLMEHDGKINETSFLRILPNQINDFVAYFKNAAVVNMLDGPHFAVVTVNGTVGGVLEVNRINRFQLDQQFVLDDGNSAPVTVFVIAIDINGGTLLKGSITVSLTRGGAAADVSAYTVAQAAKCYHPGAQAMSFNSVSSQLLSLSNGGPASLYGFTKTDYPFLQAVQIDGSGWTAATLLKDIFDGYTRRQILGKPSATLDVLMSYSLFGAVLKSLEHSSNTDIYAKGAFNVVPGSREVSVYGFQKIKIGSVTGDVMQITALQEMPDDKVLYLDWAGFTFFSNGLITRRTGKDGQQFFEERTSGLGGGYQYIVDHCLYGQVVCTSPWKQAIAHSIPSTVV